MRTGLARVSQTGGMGMHECISGVESKEDRKRSEGKPRVKRGT